MTTYTYKTKGVCSHSMTVKLEDGIIRDVRIEGGCNGNLQGISRLVTGMKAERGCRASTAAASPPPAPISCPSR